MLRTSSELQDCTTILHSLLEATEAAVFAVDKAYRYTAFNRKHADIMKALYGREIELGGCLLDYMTVPEDRFTAQANLDRALSGKRVVEEAFSGEPGQARRYFEVSHIPIRDDADPCTGVLVFARDTTEHHTADERLRQAHAAVEAEVLSRTAELRAARDALAAELELRRQAEARFSEIHERLQLAVQAAGLGIWEMRDGRLFWDERMREIYGLAETPTTWTQEDWLTRLHPDDAPRVREEIRAALREGGLTHSDFRIMRPDGAVRYIASSAQVIRDAENRPVRVIGVCRDISARRHAERALDCGQERFHLLSRNLPSMVYEILRTRTGEQRFTYLGPQVEPLHGVTAEQALADPQTIYGQLSEEDRRRVREAEERAARDLDVFSIEAKLYLPNGRERWGFFVSSPQVLANGDVRWCGLELDITARKEAEAALIRARDEAEAASRAKSAFLATISHEVRTPLNGILGFTDLALNTTLTRDQRYYLDIVKRRSLDLLAILNDILDMTRLEANRVELQSAPFDPRQILGEVERLFSIEAEQKGLSFTTRMAEEVPAPLFGDALRIKQVLVNLVGNAVKFTARGQVRVCLERDPAQPGEPGRIRLRFTVEDTGIGIPADKMSVIFQPFIQADSSTTRQYGGTGLGLTIAQRLARQMGGDVWCESEPGRGSRFFFTAQADTVAAGRPGAGSGARPEATVPATPMRRWRVLVVDDDAASRILLRRMLGQAGHEAALAEDGPEALRALAAEDFDAVLMDVLMPGLDGLELTRLIRAGAHRVRNPNIPIIAVTANAMKGDEDACLQAGMNAYVAKPIRPDSLRSVIERVLRGAVSGPAAAGSP